MDLDALHAAAMRLLHVRTSRLAEGEPVAEPIVATSTFRLGDQPPPDAIYGRYGNATLSGTEARLAEVEGAPAILSASGMAAIAGVMLACGPGGRVVLPSDGYFHSRVLARDVLGPLGLEAEEVATPDLPHHDYAGASLVLVETPSNPALDIVDLPALAAKVHAAGAVLAVDNTFCTGLLQRPLDLGADVAIAADTKAAGGHSDLILGHAATRDAGLEARLRDVRKFTGAVPGPFECWLLSRSLETLELRLGRMCGNAAMAADLLAGAGVSVTYPGRADHPGQAVARTQMARPGFVLGARFDDRAAAERFLAASGILAATSFGSTHSSADRRARWGDAVPEGFLRLSLGIEPEGPLEAALRRGLAAL